MAVSTKRFTLIAGAYQDVSEGRETCAFMIPFVSQRNSGVRLHLGVTLPAYDTTQYIAFKAPQSVNDETWLTFGDLEASDRVYLRADGADVIVGVLRK